MAPDARLADLRSDLTSAGGRLYIGVGSGGLCFAPPEQAVLVVGPPRSGKTTTLVVPNVLAAPGAVVATSTKPDVLAATLEARAALGRCWLLDPSGTVRAPAGVTRLRWSPVDGAGTWDDAVVTARALVGAARPGSAPGAPAGEAAHWSERAEALLAPLLHAAALSGSGVRHVAGWVLRHDLATPAAILTGDGGRGCGTATDVLAGIEATDNREQSGIWSTAAGVLAAYRSSAALDAAEAGAPLDPAALAACADTVYVCAPARTQELVAPVVVAWLEAVRAATYARAAAGAGGPPVVLALDEVANVAPLPGLAGMVSEAGGQGMLTLACLQDLSQARTRWGRAADGFLTLFGTTVLLPGVADRATVELVSMLAGEKDVPVRSTTKTPWWAPRPTRSDTWATRRQPRLPADDIHQLLPGTALVLAGGQRPSRVRLVGWSRLAPFAPVPPAPGLPPAQPGLPPAQPSTRRPGWDGVAPAGPGS